MSNERRIKTLKLRQKSIVTSFNLIKTFVDGYDEETQINEVPVRLENLTKLWSEYNAIQSELETLDDAALETHLKERTALESAYYRVKGFLLAHNKTELNQSFFNASQSEMRLAPSASQVRLPDVKLPVFDGQLDNWLNFHDLFVSLVHSSVDLSNIQKFYYLRSSLSDEALQLIQTIPISANNYPVAWNLLLDHFQNTARLKQSYVDNLFEFAALKQESATELHSLVEKFEANVKVLEQLGEKTKYWDLLLIRMLSIRLDPTTRRDWEEHSSSQQAITFKDLTSFIQRRVTVLQSIQQKPIEASISHQLKKPAQRSVSNHGANQNSHRTCIICSEDHPLYLCERFSNLSIDDKETEVSRHQLCRNCLRQGHQSAECSSSFSCRKCRGRHHTQLCTNSFPAYDSTPVSFQQSSDTIFPSTSNSPITSASAAIGGTISCASTSHPKTTILLATAVISIIDDNGIEHVGRALLDSGSECCFVTERFSQHIKAPRKKIFQPITGIGQASTQAKTKFTTRLRSRVGNYSTNIEFLVLPKVTIDLPATTIDISSWDLPPGVKLADPSFASSNSVDMIIGAEIFFELFGVLGRIPLGENRPMLVNSVLGWVVCGKCSNTPSNPIVAHLATRTTTIPQEFHSSIEQDIPAQQMHTKSLVKSLASTKVSNCFSPCEQKPADIASQLEEKGIHQLQLSILRKRRIASDKPQTNSESAVIINQTSQHHHHPSHGRTTDGSRNTTSSSKYYFGNHPIRSMLQPIRSSGNFQSLLKEQMLSQSKVRKPSEFPSIATLHHMGQRQRLVAAYPRLSNSFTTTPIHQNFAIKNKNPGDIMNYPLPLLGRVPANKESRAF